MAAGVLDMSAYAEPVAAMARALAGRDERAFRAALGAFDSVRDGEVLTGVRKVTVELKSALQRFEVDSRLIDLAQHQVPDARRRLAHVLKLTADAAHRTMDLVEQCRSPADRLGDQALALAAQLAAADAALAGEEQRAVPMFLREVAACMRELRAKLDQMALAQSYQDLSGQIIGSVMSLVDELQRVLGELARISELGEGVHIADETMTRGHGPAVPGVDHGDAVSGQQDVDALLSQLGM